MVRFFLLCVGLCGPMIVCANSDKAGRLFSKAEAIDPELKKSFLCPPGYDPVGHTCYLYEKAVKATWDRAEEYCQQTQGSLVNFETREEWDAALGYLRHRHKNCDVYRNTFIWTSNNAAVSRTNWQYEELEVARRFYRSFGVYETSTNGSENTVRISCLGRFFWSETSRNSKEAYNFICEAKPNYPPFNVCPEPFDIVGQGCYFLNISKTATWLEASRICAEDYKGHLLRLETESEWKTLKTILVQLLKDADCLKLADTYIWTDGLSAKEKPWMWARSGNNMTFFDWAPEEPVSFMAPSAVVLGCKQNFQWSSFPLESENSRSNDGSFQSISRNFICEGTPRILSTAIFRSEVSAYFPDFKCASIGGTCQDWRTQKCTAGYLSGLCSEDTNQMCCKPCDESCQIQEAQWSQLDAACDGDCMRETNYCPLGYTKGLCGGPRQCCSMGKIDVKATSMAGHTNLVKACTWNPTSPDILASGSSDNTVRIWDFSTTSTSRQKLQLSNSANVLSLDWSPDGSLLAAALGSGNPSHKIWSSNGTLVSEGHRPEGETVVKFSPKGTFLATGGDSGIVTLWDTATGRSKRKFHLHTSAVRHIEWQSETIFASSGNDHTVHIYDVHKGGFSEYKHSSTIFNIQWNQEKEVIASGSSDSTLKVWSTEKNIFVIDLKQTTRLRRIQWLPGNGRGGLLASALEDGTVWLWNVETGRAEDVLRKHNDVLMLSFSPDGRFLVTSGQDRHVHFWNMNSHEIAYSYNHGSTSNYIGHLEWNARGDLVVACNGKDHNWNNGVSLTTFDLRR